MLAMPIYPLLSKVVVPLVWDWWRGLRVLSEEGVPFSDRTGSTTALAEAQNGSVSCGAD